MAKVNGLFQDAEEAKFDRYTHIMVDADVEMQYHCGEIASFQDRKYPMSVGLG